LANDVSGMVGDVSGTLGDISMRSAVGPSTDDDVSRVTWQGDAVGCSTVAGEVVASSCGDIGKQGGQ